MINASKKSNASEEILVVVLFLDELIRSNASDRAVSYLLHSREDKIPKYERVSYPRLCNDDTWNMYVPQCYER